jgi:hypothetical protein
LRLAQLGNSGALAARQHGDARALHDSPCARLVAHQTDVTRARADEVQARALTCLGEVAVLGQEAVARMHRVGAEGRRGAENRRNIQIAVFGRRRPDTDRLVGHPHVQRILVRGRVNRDRGDTELAAGPDYANCDCSAICDQQFFEHRRALHPVRSLR